MSDLLRAVIRRHGGLAEWHRVSEVSATLKFGGLAFAARWCRGTSRPRRLIVDAHSPRVTLCDYPSVGMTGHFTRGRVWLEDSLGRERASRDDPRGQFRSLRRQLWWDELDLLYFAGYASWNYLTTPFLLAKSGVQVNDLGPWHEGGRWLNRFRVEFPESIPTHSRRQEFYVDDQDRICRLDYDPGVFASWARAAHYCDRFEEVDGFLFATQRRVVPRAPDRTSLPGPTLVWIDLSEITVSRGARSFELRERVGRE